MAAGLEARKQVSAAGAVAAVVAESPFAVAIVAAVAGQRAVVAAAAGQPFVAASVAAVVHAPAVAVIRAAARLVAAVVREHVVAAVRVAARLAVAVVHGRVVAAVRAVARPAVAGCRGLSVAAIRAVPPLAAVADLGRVAAEVNAVAAAPEPPAVVAARCRTELFVAAVATFAGALAAIAFGPRRAVAVAIAAVRFADGALQADWAFAPAERRRRAERQAIMVDL